MKRIFGVAAGLLAGASLVAAVAAQEPGEASGPAAPEAAVDRFLAEKSAQQSRSEAALKRRGRGADSAEIRGLLKAARIDSPKPFGIDGERSARLTDSLATDAAHYLAGLGYKPVDLRAMADGGFDALGAALRLIRGTSNQMDRLALAPYVVVGDVVEVRVEDLGDGFGSTAVFRPRTFLSSPQGATPKGDILIRQLSGTTTGRGQTFYSSDLSTDDKGSYLLLLSDQRYQQVSEERGRRPRQNGPSATYMARTAFDQIRVSGDGASFAAPLEDGTTTVSALEAKLGAIRK